MLISFQNSSPLYLRSDVTHALKNEISVMRSVLLFDILFAVIYNGITLVLSFSAC